MRRGRTILTLVASLALLIPTSGGAQNATVGAEASAGANFSSNGTNASLEVDEEGVWIDPGLLDAFDLNLTQVAILVLDPAAESGVLDQVVRLGLEHHLYEELHMVSLVMQRDHLDVLGDLPGVFSIHRNEAMQPTLDRSADYVGSRVVWDTYRVTGRGVTILIVDSGVDGTHPDLKYRENLIENVVATRQASGLVGGSKAGVVSSDPDGHGTHVAGVVGGTGKAPGSDSGKYRGIAPGSRLVGYQAGLADPDTGEITFESVTVLEAFNWALSNREKYQLRIVSNSWGANGDFDPKSPVNIATLNLYKAGIAVTFAAGNEGDKGSHTLNKYCVAPWVLCITAGDYYNQVPKFASRGSKNAPYDHPDLVAPGIGITSTRALTSGSVNGKAHVTPGPLYVSKSGTSMAVPHASGALALLLEANPNLSPDDLYDILTATATPMDRYGVEEAGAGYLNAFKAYQLARNAKGSRAEFLSGTVKYAGPASGDAAYAKDAVSVGYGKGAAVRLRSPDKSLDEFAQELVTTPHGLVFLIGSLLLGAVAFGPGSGASVTLATPTTPAASAARTLGPLVHRTRQETTPRPPVNPPPPKRGS